MSKSSPVLVVGAGPVGLTMALLLARMGVPCLVAERRAAPSASPRAHAVNPRSLEIMAAAGVDMAALRRLAAPRGEAGCVRFVTRLLGKELGALPYERADDGALALTPTPILNIPQSDLEAVLLEAAMAQPLIEVRWGCEWLSDDGTASVVVDAAGGVNAIPRRFLIACDGAGSPVRRALGVRMEGAGRIASNVNIQFEADLGERLQDRPAILYWILDPAAAGVVIAYRLGRLMVLAHNYDPVAEPPESFTPERCLALVQAAVGDPGVGVAITGAAHWTMTCEVAERYRQGDVFLVGDAAHRFPPAGGLGLNTGVGDAHNLAWKIAAVLAGQGTDRLLDTYQSERLPIALANADQSLTNVRRMGRLIRETAKTWDAERGEPGAAMDLPGQIEAQREHFDSLGLQLGYWYANGTGHASATVSAFDPRMEPGHRLPHAWIERDGRRASSLDLVSATTFTVIAGPEGEAWRSAAAAAPVAAFRLGEDFLDPLGGWSSRGGPQGRGAVLVRPDGHIAAVFADDHEAERRLAAALSACLAP